MVTRRLLAALFLLLATAHLAHAQAWIPLVNQPNANLGLSNPLLLTDGTVIAHQACGSQWWRLTPDPFGSYINGTWKRIASLPSGYGPLYFGSAVLPDGRVIMMGGEYNANAHGCPIVWTDLGAIYDPRTDKWTSVPAPKFFGTCCGFKHPTIGDAQGVVLADGTYMQANCCTTQAALLDAATLTWKPTGSGKFDINDEEGWTLLPNNDVLTVDAYVFHYAKNGKNYEIYDPQTGEWKSKGPTPVQLWDSAAACGGVNIASQELGPGVLRPDGTVFYAGANSCGASHTAIYDTLTRTWTAGPDFPDHLGVGDGPATLLPDGNVLVQTSPRVFGTGSRFFIWNGSTLADVTAGNTDAPLIPSYFGNMLILPTGEILWTDFGNVWVFQHGGQPKPEWLPQIVSAPSDVSRGHTYTVSGFNFNGFSQGAAYGDDFQAATNYPLVQITNRVTGNVYYARTHDHSTMAVAYSGMESTQFDVPAIETGLSNLVVICNGISSSPVTVDVH